MSGPIDDWAIEQLTGDPGPDQIQLAAAFRAAQNPIGRHVPLGELVEAYTIAGYYYAISKDEKRRATSDNKLDAQLTEDYLEALVKSLDKAYMATMHLGKQERYAGS